MKIYEDKQNNNKMKNQEGIPNGKKNRKFVHKLYLSNTPISNLNPA